MHRTFTMKSVRGGQEGSASILVLVLLIFMAAAAGGVVRLLDVSLLARGKSIAAYESRRSLRREADRVLAALGGDATPSADSPLDAVWSALATPELEGATLSLSDVSSALDPNWIQKNVFSKTGLGSLLTDAGSADILQQRRVDRGFSIDLQGAYGDLFKEGVLAKYFTSYGYANLNVTDEFALQKLYALRTGDPAASEVFHTKVQQLLREQRLLRGEELRTFLGSAHDVLYPIMNVEPCMNVHYVDPLLLRELLGYPDFGVPHPREAADAILSARDRSEIASSDLHRMIGAPATSRIYQYLGTVTWFWKVTVSRSNRALVMIVARIPRQEEGLPAFIVVEERISPP